MKRFLVLTFALALVAAPAFAHVTANPNQATTGDYFQTSFRITHGCEESDTVAIHVKIPAGIVSVHPQAKPGWEIEIKKRPLNQPVIVHGKSVDEAVDEVTWHGNTLPDDQYDDFGLVMKMPDTAQILWFPTTQTCEKGENAWVEIPPSVQEWHHVEHPAPYVVLSAPTTPMPPHHH